MPSRPVQRVGAGAEFRVPGEQAYVVREGVEAFAEDALGRVVMVVVVLGHMGAGEGQEKSGVAPVGFKRGPCDSPRLGRSADGDECIDPPPHVVTHVVTYVLFVVVHESPPLVQQAGRTRPRLSLSPVPEPWVNRKKTALTCPDLLFYRPTGCNRTYFEPCPDSGAS